jgi:hypothetical protein
VLTGSFSCTYVVCNQDLTPAGCLLKDNSTQHDMPAGVCLQRCCCIRRLLHQKTVCAACSRLGLQGLKACNGAQTGFAVKIVHTSDAMGGMLRCMQHM